MLPSPTAITKGLQRSDLVRNLLELGRGVFEGPVARAWPPARQGTRPPARNRVPPERGTNGRAQMYGAWTRLDPTIDVGGIRNGAAGCELLGRP